MSNKTKTPSAAMLNFDKFQGQRLTESRRTPDAFLKYNIERKSLDDKELDIDVVNKIFEADPSKNHAYVNWLVLLFTRMEKSVFLEDLHKATSYLTIFDKAKHKFKEERQRNIFNYKSLPELYDVIEPFLEDQTKILSKRQLRGDTPVEGQYDIIFSSDEWDIIIPHTHKAACYWGSGTQWCTAVDSNPGYYESYTKNGPLYIFRHKTDKDVRFQLHVQSKQFMDRKDARYSPDKFFEEHKDIRDILVEYWKEHPDVLKSGNQNPVTSLLNNSYGDSDNWTEILMMIVNSGFDLNFEDSNGESALIKVAGNLNMKLLEFFLNKGADPNKANSKGVTPMSAAVAQDDTSKKSGGDDTNLDNITLEVCKMLYKYGAVCSGMAPNTNSSSTTILVQAITKRKLATAKWLCDKEGYDIHFKDGSTKNALLYVAVNTCRSDSPRFSVDDAYYMIDVMIKRGIDVNCLTKSTKRSSLFMFAQNANQSNNFIKIIKLLLDNGADPCIKYNPDPETDSELSKTLLESGRVSDKDVIELLKKYSKNC